MRTTSLSVTLLSIHLAYTIFFLSRAWQTRLHLDLTAFDGGSGYGTVFVDGLGDLVDYEGVGQINLSQPLVGE